MAKPTAKNMKDIIRFKKNGSKSLIMRNVSDEQAKEWCSSEYTRKKGKYFDGFAESGTCCVNKAPKYTNYFKPNEEYN